jgi:hypothetical protein
LCRICGIEGPLTFEHVPPRRAYNDYPLVLFTLDEWENGEGGTFTREGRGGHYLCERCNNQTGGNYGGAFVNWARQGMQRIHQIPDKSSMNYHGVIYPLRVLKQIAVIFFDTALPAEHDNHQELARFVMDPESNQLPDNYRFLVFWYGGGGLRQTGIVGVLNIEENQTNVLAEFVHPPFGYVLALSADLADNRPADISDFAHFGFNEAITLNRRFPVLETHWIMPGDYRTLDQIARDEAINTLEANGVENARLLVERFEKG